MLLFLVCPSFVTFVLSSTAAALASTASCNKLPYPFLFLGGELGDVESMACLGGGNVSSTDPALDLEGELSSGCNFRQLSDNDRSPMISGEGNGVKSDIVARYGEVKVDADKAGEVDEAILDAERVDRSVEPNEYIGTADVSECCEARSVTTGVWYIVGVSCNRAMVTCEGLGMSVLMLRALAGESYFEGRNGIEVSVSRTGRRPAFLATASSLLWLLSFAAVFKLASCSCFGEMSSS